MFKNNQENYDNSENFQDQDFETIIGPSVKLEGNLIGEGNISIHGCVSGKIETKGNLLVGDSAKIKAEINAANISIAGLVEGNITSAQKLEIIENGKVIGDISSQMLSIAPGALFSGQSNMHNNDESAPKNKSEKTTEE